jgi:hypothetical protein
MPLHLQHEAKFQYGFDTEKCVVLRLLKHATIKFMLTSFYTSSTQSKYSNYSYMKDYSHSDITVSNAQSLQ